MMFSLTTCKVYLSLSFYLQGCGRCKPQPHLTAYRNNAMINLKYTRFLIIICIFTVVILSVFRINTSLAPTTTVTHHPVSRSIKGQNFPGAYVKEENFVPSNVSYCEFQFGFPKELKYVAADVDLEPELGKQGNYRVLYNVIGAKVDGTVPGITYATHITADFAYYIPELIR